MLVQRTGLRWDGQDWPDRGGEIDVPDDEGAALCGQGDAVPVVTGDVETPERPDVAVEIRSVTTEDDGTGPDDGGFLPEPAARPIVNSPKAAWVEYAVTQGADRETAEAMKKADLITAYGG